MTITRMQQPRQMYQEGGIMPRLNQLGSGVSSAEQMLQGINQRLESAESSLGSSGGQATFELAGGNTTTQPPINLGQLPAPYDQRGPFNAQDAYANAQKEAQEQRQKGFLGQVVLPGEMSFDDFSKNFGAFNNFGQPMQLPASGGPGGGMQSSLQQAMGFSNGGRIGYALGSPEENAIQASGIMGLPLNENPAGVTELDLRESGGFIPPVGVKEKADDIPAMLSNNEFVFTADAVRGMGDGDVNKGAQRMYDMMKKLENGGRV